MQRKIKNKKQEQELNQIKKIVLPLIKKAGLIALKEFQKKEIKISSKSKFEILTQTDLKVEKIILKAIKKHFPQHQIFSEESGKINQKSKNDWLWLIDPIDGTTNFAHHHPLFAISIAVVYQKEIVFGAIYAPVTKELYWAGKNKGAWLNNKEIHVSQNKNLKNGMLMGGNAARKQERQQMTSVYPHFLEVARHYRDLGSAALELAWVATGRADGVILFGPRSFDVAAGVILTQEAGGKITNFQNKAWTIKDPYLIASNQKVHSQLIKLI